MKRTVLMIGLGILFFISLILVFILNYRGQFLFGSLLCIFSIFIGAMFFTLYFLFKSDKVLYRNKLNEILEKYKEILNESTTMPNLDGKNVVIVGSMDELNEAQKHLKKSIYYKREKRCCAFFLLDSDEACIYILKVNDGVVSDLETIMREVKERKINSKVFSAIDKSMVIKLENSRVFKISTKESKIDFGEEANEGDII